MLVFLLFLTLGCANETTPHQPQSRPKVSTPAPTTKPAPQPSKSPSKPAGENTVGLVSTAGADTYKQYCVACHQADGTGMNGMLATDLTDPKVLSKTDAVLLETIRKGVVGNKGQMPAWGATLSDSQMKGVLTYIRVTFQK